MCVEIEHLHCLSYSTQIETNQCLSIPTESAPNKGLLKYPVNYLDKYVGTRMDRVTYQMLLNNKSMITSVVKASETVIHKYNVCYLSLRYVFILHTCIRYANGSPFIAVVFSGSIGSMAFVPLEIAMPLFQFRSVLSAKPLQIRIYLNPNSYHNRGAQVQNIRSSNENTKSLLTVWRLNWDSGNIQWWIHAPNMLFIFSNGTCFFISQRYNWFGWTFDVDK